jgi:hypothetical protein
MCKCGGVLRCRVPRPKYPSKRPLFLGSLSLCPSLRLHHSTMLGCQLVDVLHQKITSLTLTHAWHAVRLVLNNIDVAPDLAILASGAINITAVRFHVQTSASIMHLRVGRMTRLLCLPLPLHLVIVLLFLQEFALVIILMLLELFWVVHFDNSAITLAESAVQISNLDKQSNR